MMVLVANAQGADEDALDLLAHHRVPERARVAVAAHGMPRPRGRLHVVGHARFDEDFIIQSNDAAQVRALFANERIRFLIDSLPAIHFSIADHGHSFWGLPKGIDELCLTMPDAARDLPTLKLLFELFSETLDELGRLGLLLPEDVGPLPG